MIVTIKTNNLPQIQMTGNAQTMKINIMKSTRRMYWYILLKETSVGLWYRRYSSRLAGRSTRYACLSNVTSKFICWLYIQCSSSKTKLSRELPKHSLMKKWCFYWWFFANSDMQRNMFSSRFHAVFCEIWWNLLDIIVFRIIVQSENKIRMKVLHFRIAFGSVNFCWKERIKFCKG